MVDLDNDKVTPRQDTLEDVAAEVTALGQRDQQPQSRGRGTRLRPFGLRADE